MGTLGGAWLIVGNPSIESATIDDDYRAWWNPSMAVVRRRRIPKGLLLVCRKIRLVRNFNFQNMNVRNQIKDQIKETMLRHKTST
jgi:hypothetical protein